LKGKLGDKINAIAMAIGFNLRKILKKLSLWVFNMLFQIVNTNIKQPKKALF